ncbi:Ig-like domain-containing protein [Eubacterium sp. MSJ-13]|uniref:Ig-like domain-containing protein n=1 Tax=Eubacterium sp. MSJ-13 TaxID=2841513 RepID=UPI00209D792C|nr:Ig-like domain-containing protein [Eubacterium sp. MSJ-13]
MRLSRRKILALCMSGALVLSSIPGMYIKSVAAKKSDPAVIKLNTTNVKLVKGKKKTLKVTVKNVKTLKKVTFTSKNKKVASVTAKGVVTAVKAGNTKIEVKVSYIPKDSQKVSSKTVRCTIRVTNPEDTTDVAPDMTAQATATPAPVVYGEAGKVSEYNKEKSNFSLSVDASDKVHDISDILYGIFIEDINFAADGGLYAEMVQNRSFEFTKLASDNEKHAWSNV